MLSSRLLSIRWSTRRAATTFSMTLDKNGRLETGRKFFNISGLSELFLSNGLTIADLCSKGKWPEDKQRLTMWAMTGSNGGRT